MPEKVLELAYDAAKSVLAGQDNTLGNIRNRTTALFTAGAMAVSFTAGIGLIGADGQLPHHYPTWAAIILLLILTAMATAVMRVHWPARGFHYGPSATVLLELHQAGIGEDEARQRVIEKMIEGCTANEVKLKRKRRALQCLVCLLWLEILVIIIAIALT